MDELVSQWLEAVQLGEPQTSSGLAVVPLFNPVESHVPYIALTSALERGSVTVTESTVGGIVGDLIVVNSGPSPVLVLDGEELAGAKQNRIANTTILLKERSESTLPVSCTERGRWSYVSRTFHDSLAFAPPHMRRLNQAAVARSLRNARGFRADQAEVWAEVEQMADASGVRSETSAMRDVFRSRLPELDNLVKSTPVLPYQCGLLVTQNAEPVGFDLVSRPDVYAALHARLVRSYCLGLSARGRSHTPNHARQFIDASRASTGTCGPSHGYGEDHRFHGKGVTGSALTFDDEVVHVAFFADPRDEDPPGPTTLRSAAQRRRYRM